MIFFSKVSLAQFNEPLRTKIFGHPRFITINHDEDKGECKILDAGD